MTRSIIRGTYVVLRGGWGCAGGVDVAVLLKVLGGRRQLGELLPMHYVT
jgi:hypothetical protein